MIGVHKPDQSLYNFDAFDTYLVGRVEVLVCSAVDQNQCLSQADKHCTMELHQLGWSFDACL
jgi:hypothetical protein